MSELGDIFREHKRQRKIKRADNANKSLNQLELHQIPHVICNHAIPHVVVVNKFDFWPSTGKWRERGNGRTGRGVQSLMRAIESRKNGNV